MGQIKVWWVDRVWLVLVEILLCRFCPLRGDFACKPFIGNSSRLHPLYPREAEGLTLSIVTASVIPAMIFRFPQWRRQSPSGGLEMPSGSMGAT